MSSITLRSKNVQEMVCKSFIHVSYPHFSSDISKADLEATRFSRKCNM